MPTDYPVCFRQVTGRKFHQSSVEKTNTLQLTWISAAVTGQAKFMELLMVGDMFITPR